MRIAILGFGVEGRSLAAYLKPRIGKRADEVVICDEKLEKLPAEFGGFGARLGKDAFKKLGDFDKIFRSPGIAYTRPELKGLGKKLTSVTDYFLKNCPCPVIGVTGTKGKGTTSSLIFAILKEWFEGAGVKRVGPARHVYLGGNIGTSPLTFLDKLTKEDLVVLELSSFQLQDVSVSPHVAVMLGISQDHMDQHGGMQEYIDAKRQLLAFQKKGDVAVLDIDNEVVKGFEKGSVAKVVKVTSRGRVTLPWRAEKFQLRGVHNVKNGLMAAAAARAVGAPEKIIAHAIEQFKPLPHRLEFVCTKNGAAFYNDSLSTNPSTTIAAIRSFTEPLTLILGGRDKNLDFESLAQEIAGRDAVVRVILMGEARTKLEKALDAACATRVAPLEIIFAESYMEAFMVAKLMAQPGEVVLLSPACTSFDMFANYAERGEIFSRFMRE